MGNAQARSKALVGGMENNTEKDIMRVWMETVG